MCFFWCWSWFVRAFCVQWPDNNRRTHWCLWKYKDKCIKPDTSHSGMKKPLLLQRRQQLNTALSCWRDSWRPPSPARFITDVDEFTPFSKLFPRKSLSTSDGVWNKTKSPFWLPREGAHLFSLIFPIDRQSCEHVFVFARDVRALGAFVLSYWWDGRKLWTRLLPACD